MPNRKLIKIYILERPFGSSVGQNVENQPYLLIIMMTFHREHIASSLEIPTHYCCEGMQSEFTVSVLRNINIDVWQNFVKLSALPKCL